MTDERPRPSWAEGAPQESGDLFSRVLESSADSVSINVIEDGTFLYVNDALLRRTGYRREELIGHHADEFDIFVDPELMAEITKRLAKEGSIGSIEGRFRSRGGDISS